MKLATVNTETFYTTTDAAEVLGISKDSVRRYCANSEEGKTPAIKAVRVARSWVISPAELKKFKEKRNPVGRPKDN